MVVWSGNQIAYGNGGRWWVECEVWDGGVGTGPTATLWYVYRLRSNYSLYDSTNSFSWYDPWSGGQQTVNNINISHGGSGGATVLVGGNPNTASVGLSYGAATYLRFFMSMTGLTGGGPSQLLYDYGLGARVPVVPNAPGTGVDSITPTSARIVVHASTNNGGAGVDQYAAYILSNNAWPGAGGNVVAQATGGTFTAKNLLPGTRYYYTARAHNAAGWGPWQPMKVFDTLPAMLIKVGGAWKNAIPMVKVGGAWKNTEPYIKVNGVWRRL